MLKPIPALSAPQPVNSSNSVPQPVRSSNPVPQPVQSSNPVPAQVSSAPNVNEQKMQHDMRVHNPDEDAMSETDLERENQGENDDFMESLDNVIHDLENEETSGMNVDSPRNKRKEDERDVEGMDEGFLNIKGFRKLMGRKKDWDY